MSTSDASEKPRIPLQRRLDDMKVGAADLQKDKIDRPTLNFVLIHRYVNNCN